MGAYRDQQTKGDPVIIGIDVAAEGGTEQPADRWCDGFAGTKDQTDLQRVRQPVMALRCALGQGGGKGVDRQAEGQDQ
jgi:hypothetical protein